MKPRLAVVGSINMDLVVRCTRLPAPGQTVLAQSSQEHFGGKGANQAVAAARAGGEVRMIGCVGDDLFASKLIANLEANNVAADSIQQIANCSSGLAIVGVEDSGQNSIMVVPAANDKLSVDHVRQCAAHIESADVILLQLEVPIDAVAEAIRIAHSAGRRVILDPAPAPNVWPGLLAHSSNQPSQLQPGISLICPNESEAAVMTGLTVQNRDQAEAAAKVLYEQGVSAVAITLAENGVLLYDGSNSHWISPVSVTAVDTTAAGDAFAGALAVRWAESNDLLQAVRFANAAGAIAVTRAGAQAAMATRIEIETLYRG